MVMTTIPDNVTKDLCDRLVAEQMKLIERMGGIAAAISDELRADMLRYSCAAVVQSIVTLEKKGLIPIWKHRPPIDHPFADTIEQRMQAVLADIGNIALNSNFRQWWMVNMEAEKQ